MIFVVPVTAGVTVSVAISVAVAGGVAVEGAAGEAVAGAHESNRRPEDRSNRKRKRDREKFISALYVRRRRCYPLAHAKPMKRLYNAHGHKLRFFTL